MRKQNKIVICHVRMSMHMGIPEPHEGIVSIESPHCGILNAQTDLSGGGRVTGCGITHKRLPLLGESTNQSYQVLYIHSRSVMFRSIFKSFDHIRSRFMNSQAKIIRDP